MVRASIIVLALLAGCSSEPDTSEARKAVLAQMRDPDSAKFRNVELNSNGTVCGEVNGTNAFGGMTGFQPFAYIAGTTVFYGPGRHYDESTVIINACSAKFDQMIRSMRTQIE